MSNYGPSEMMEYEEPDDLYNEDAVMPCWKIPSLRKFLRDKLEKKTELEKETGQTVILVPVKDMLLKLKYPRLKDYQKYILQDLLKSDK